MPSERASAESDRRDLSRPAATDSAPAAGESERAQREQELGLIGQLAGGLAHDLNSLLTIVIGNLQLLKQEGAKLPGLPRRVEAALGASARAADLTRRLLGMSQLQPMRIEAVDPAALVGDLASQLRRTWGASVVIETQIDCEVGSVQTDRQQLESALENLCLNARAALAPGGRLRLSVREVAVEGEPPPSQPSLEPGLYVALEVRDDGAGMTPDVLARAFDPFFTTKELGNGAGLGLSVVHGFARRAHGAVHLASAPGEGTCAVLYLPTARVRPPQIASRLASIPRETPHATILVVEDDEDVREFATEVLREAGYSVCEASDGRSAFAILRSERPLDLLVTDLLMPGGVTGKQVAEEARTRRSHIPVLYASGYAPDTLLREGGLASHESFLAKPYDADGLVRSVQSALARRDAS